MEAKQIREKVSGDYAKAIKAVKPSCCDFSCGCTQNNKTMAELNAYAPEEIKAHANAAESSFGCGNPLAFTDVKTGEVVLDLGSGAGFDLLIAGDKVGPTGKVIGVDMTQEMIDKARRNIEAAGVTNIELRKGIIEEMPVETMSVDWVISNCVINLSPEKDRVFREIFRVLKPGGRMLISDIVVEELPASIRNHPGLYSSCISGAISEKEYLAGLAQAGLTDIRITDRFIYDTATIKGILNDDQGCVATIFGDLSEQEKKSRIDRLLDEAEGKIQSIKVSARKPN